MRFIGRLRSFLSTTPELSALSKDIQNMNKDLAIMSDKGWNNINPDIMWANSYMNVERANHVMNKDRGYMWEAQFTGMFKSILSVFDQGSISNAIKVNTQTGEREFKYTEQDKHNAALNFIPGGSMTKKFVNAYAEYDEDGNYTGNTKVTNKKTAAMLYDMLAGIPVFGVVLAEKLKKEDLGAEYSRYDELGNPDLGDAGNILQEAIKALALIAGIEGAGGATSTATQTANTYNAAGALQGLGVELSKNGILGKLIQGQASGWTSLIDFGKNLFSGNWSAILDNFTGYFKDMFGLSSMANGDATDGFWTKMFSDNYSTSEKLLLPFKEVISTGQKVKNLALVGHYEDNETLFLKLFADSLQSGQGLEGLSEAEYNFMAGMLWEQMSDENKRQSIAPAYLRGNIERGGQVEFERGDTLAKLLRVLRAKTGLDLTLNDLQDYYQIDDDEARHIAVGTRFTIPMFDKPELYQLIEESARHGTGQMVRDFQSQLAQYYNYRFLFNGPAIVSIDRPDPGYTLKADEVERTGFIAISGNVFEQYLFGQPQNDGNNFASRARRLWGDAAFDNFNEGGALGHDTGMRKAWAELLLPLLNSRGHQGSPVPDYYAKLREEIQEGIEGQSDAYLMGFLRQMEISYDLNSIAGEGAVIGLALLGLGRRYTRRSGVHTRAQAARLTYAEAEASASSRLAQLEARAGSRAHFYSRHGAHTTRQQQWRRATTGVTPDGQVRPAADSSRFLSHQQQLQAVEKATAIYKATGKTTIDFTMNATVGEGYLRGGSTLRTTQRIRAYFSNGQLQTIFPVLR